MKTPIKTRISKVNFYEPVNNLPGKTSNQKNSENQVAIQFSCAYLNQFETLHHKSSKTSIACAREVQINGFGIADFVTVAWNTTRLKTLSKLDSELFINNARPTMRAFEFKLSNWRRALMRASRYKFFSNVSIVVLPVEKCGTSLKYLDTFKKIRVGLWGYDKNSNRIMNYFTPKPNKAIDSKHQIMALKLIASASKSLPVS
ncbi:MAG: hypothetical protein MRJ65_16220 [Candidatus Brocadiaceae bacterium]|nr:hypothetical protein [Candidatus Brocadiaceae bacterium]